MLEGKAEAFSYFSPPILCNPASGEMSESADGRTWAAGK